jgi:hypothetical protein
MDRRLGEDCKIVYSNSGSPALIGEGIQATAREGRAQNADLKKSLEMSKLTARSLQKKLDEMLLERKDFILQIDLLEQQVWEKDSTNQKQPDGCRTLTLYGQNHFGGSSYHHNEVIYPLEAKLWR